MPTSSWPICTSQELNDINPGYQLSPQIVFMNKCIEPLFESKTDMDACKLVADKLGLGSGFIPDTEDNMLKAVWAGTSAWNGGMTYAEFKAAGVAKYNRWANPTVFLKNFIANPATGTPKPSVASGKIEFYSTAIKNLITEGKISGVDTQAHSILSSSHRGPWRSHHGNLPVSRWSARELQEVPLNLCQHPLDQGNRPGRGRDHHASGRRGRPRY